MKPQHCIQPPRVATWLVNLFTPVHESESIAGDLQEEFSHLALESGASPARRWYWRQTFKTVAHLAGAGFSMAPWSTVAAIVGGFLLMRLVSGLPEQAIAAMVNRTSFYEHHFGAYMFWMTSGIDLGHILMAALVGGCVAWAARGREMVAAIALALIGCVLGAAALCVWLVRGHDLLLWRLSWQLADSFAIVIGGAFVRMRRSAYHLGTI